MKEYLLCLGARRQDVCMKWWWNVIHFNFNNNTVNVIKVEWPEHRGSISKRGKEFFPFIPLPDRLRIQRNTLSSVYKVFFLKGKSGQNVNPTNHKLVVSRFNCAFAVPYTLIVRWDIKNRDNCTMRRSTVSWEIQHWLDKWPSGPHSWCKQGIKKSNFTSKRLKPVVKPVCICLTDRSISSPPVMYKSSYIHRI